MDHKEYLRICLETHQKPAATVRDDLVVRAYVVENIAIGTAMKAVEDFQKKFADWLADQGYPWTANALRDGSWEKRT